jgi:hypothetical protein
MRVARCAGERVRGARVRAAIVITAAWCVLVLGLAAQTVLDQVLVRFGGEIITQLDVRQARMLKLVSVPNDTDQAYVDALVNRRLILSDLKRTSTAEPTTEATDAKARQWEASLGPGVDVAALLERAGMTQAGLRGWMRDGLRVQAYLDERFAGRAADLAGWIATLRQRAGIR